MTEPEVLGEWALERGEPGWERRVVARSDVEPVVVLQQERPFRGIHARREGLRFDQKVRRRRILFGAGLIRLVLLLFLLRLLREHRRSFSCRHSAGRGEGAERGSMREWGEAGEGERKGFGRVLGGKDLGLQSIRDDVDSSGRLIEWMAV